MGWPVEADLKTMQMAVNERASALAHGGSDGTRSCGHGGKV